MSSPWLRIADFGALGAWISIAAFTLHYHEKWADEAQAWLIARDLPLSRIWFHELRYEGSPGLWHTILWIAQHLFHLGYDSLGIIGMVGATAGVAVLVFKAPFPRYIRWPLAFSYFMLYQYAVIARPYTLLPLLCFAAAILFKDLQHPGRMTVILVLLANLSLHGTILAACFGLAYVIDAWKQRATLESPIRRRYWISIAVMLATFAFIVVILKPTPDVEEFAVKREIAALPLTVQAQFPSGLRKLNAILCGAFFDWTLPSALFVAVAGLWCGVRRRLLPFTLLVGSMLALYAAIHGAAHHQGTAFVAMIAALWIAWPEPSAQNELRAHHTFLTRLVLALLVCLGLLNIWDSAVTINRERLYPYSGAEDAAKYLKSVNAEQSGVFGLLFGVVAIQPYFNHNIFANVNAAYFHHGAPFTGTSLNTDELHRINPEYIVAYSQEPEMMMQSGIPLLTAEGYAMVHFSDGYYLYKRAVYEREVYFVLRRVNEP